LYKDINQNFINGSFIINLTLKDPERLELKQGMLIYDFRGRKLYES